MAKYGSWNHLGWRVGIDPTGNVRPTERTGKYSLLNWGFGVPHSPIFTYAIVLPDMTPANNQCFPAQYIPPNGGWLLQETSVVVDPVNGNQTIPVYGGPYPVPRAVAGKGGATYNSAATDGANQKNAFGALRTQCMWPTTALITFSAAQDPLAGFGATLFGYDWYGQSIQEFIDLSAGGATFNGTKAFWGFTGCFFNNNAPTGNPTVSVSTTTTLGLPWRLYNKCDYIQSGQGTATGAVTYTAGVGGVSTATSGDPRGTFVLTAPTANDPVRFTYYVAGADAWLAMLSTYQSDNAATFPQFPHIDYPDVDALYGHVPYFTGVVE